MLFFHKVIYIFSLRCSSSSYLHSCSSCWVRGVRPPPLSCRRTATRTDTQTSCHVRGPQCFFYMFHLFYELFFFDKHLCTHIACCQPLSFSGVSSLQSLPFKVHQPPPLFVLHPSYSSHPVILCLSTEPMLPAHIHRLIFLSHLPLKCSSSLHPPSNFVASFSIFFTSFFPGAENYRIFDFLQFSLYLEFSVIHTCIGPTFIWYSPSSWTNMFIWIYLMYQQWITHFSTCLNHHEASHVCIWVTRYVCVISAHPFLSITMMDDVTDISADQNRDILGVSMYCFCMN